MTQEARVQTVQTKQEARREELVRPGRTYLPAVDICETDEALYLWADMPGVDEKSVEVRLDEDVLTIEGQVSAADYQNMAPVYTEYNVGNFFRRFRISSEIDANRIRARMVNGVLELELPKVEQARPRRIEVTAG